MKKLFKKKPKKLSDYKFRIIFDEKLDRINMEDIAPPKVAEFNEKISKWKLPKELL